MCCHRKASVTTATHPVTESLEVSSAGSSSGESHIWRGNNGKPTEGGHWGANGGGTTGGHWGQRRGDNGGGHGGGIMGPLGPTEGE